MAHGKLLGLREEPFTGFRMFGVRISARYFGNFNDGSMGEMASDTLNSHSDFILTHSAIINAFFFPFVLIIEPAPVRAVIITIESQRG